MGLLAKILRRHDGRSLAQVPRADSWTGISTGGAYGGRWVNPASGMGGPLDRSQRDEYVAGLPVDQWLADALLETNAIARRIAAREAEDCTREGYDITGMDPGLADALEQYCEGGDDQDGLGVLGALAEARTWARAYGGGALVLLVDDGRDPHEPIDRANIRRVRGVLSANRYELPVQAWDHAGNPLMYRVQLNSPGGRSRVWNVHADRIVRLRGQPLPRHLSHRRQGWDGSIFDTVYAPLRAYGSTHVQACEAVGLLNQGVLTSPGLTDALETEEGARVFQMRLEAMRMAMGTYGEVALGDKETYEIHNRSLAGLGDAVKAAVDALVAAADGMPRLILLGEPTAGLSDTTGGELRMWYDTCSSRQPKIYTPALKRVIRLVMLSHEGPTGGRAMKFDVEWRPLWQETETTRADLDLKRSQRRSVDIAAGVVTTAEARRDPSVVEVYGELGPEAPSLEPPGSEPLDSDEPLVDAEHEPVEPEGVVTLAPEPPSTKPMPPDLMEPAEAAKLARISTHRIRKLMRSGALPYWSWGGADRVSLDDVTRLGQQHRQQDAWRTDPFAGYEDFEACVVDQRRQGASEQAARKICGALQSKSE